MTDNVISPVGYDEGSIKVLEGIDHIRLRPGMYVGGTDLGALHHLVYEIVDNAVDEALAGRCDRIEIVLQDDNIVTVADNGVGIPVGVNRETGLSTLEVVFTKTGAGGKFDNSAYKVSGGLHGVGAAAVNALSERLVAEVYRDGKLWRQEFSRGRPLTPVTAVRDMLPGESTGTVVTFQPDFTIMQPNDFSYETLLRRFREIAFVNRALTITLRDERVHPFPQEMTFYFDGGLGSYVRYLNRNREALHPVIHVQREVDVAAEGEAPRMIDIEVAFQYTDAGSVTEIAFANTIITPDGGTHLTGLRSAITGAINRYARKTGMLKEKDANFSGRDTLEGITAVVSVKLPNPSFGGQTKEKLINPEVQGVVSGVVTEAFNEFLDVNAREAKRIVEKCMLSMRAYEAARKARDLVRSGPSLLESSSLPGKLADCSQHGAGAEIFLVEGDSAGGCFSGDTRVALADGRALSFLEIIEEQKQGKRHFCYTLRHDGMIGLEEIIHPRMTRRSASVVRVTLDNGEQIICTPDHQFMLRDGSYKPAASLSPDDALMPLYRTLSDKSQPGITIQGYEMVWDVRSQTWIFTHKLADWYNRWKKVYTKESGEHCHHIDFNKRNNNPDNIVRLSKDDHLSVHREHVAQTLHREDSIAKWRQTRNSQAYRLKMSKRIRQLRSTLSLRAKKQWANPEYKEFMRMSWLAFYASNPEYRQANEARLYTAQKLYWSEAENRQTQSQRVKRYFAENEAARIKASERSREQWQDEKLLEWRRAKTSEQWTPDFKTRRRLALQETYYRKTMEALKSIHLRMGFVSLPDYQELRLRSRDKTLLRFDKFIDRYFDGDESRAIQAVELFNHRVISVESLDERIDVYDIEVPNTHNFALESGVFVHNSAKQARDRHFQAILPLRGKILNTERARLDKMLDNNEIKALIAALGTGISEDMDVSKLRYHRVVLMTDADVDGAHIRTLLLTFFFRHMHPIIANGHLYIAQPPIFRLQHGKDARYFYPEAGKSENEILQAALAGFKDPDKVKVSRYKGLGEMNPEQLWETTMDPTRRAMLQVTIDDAAEADHVFDMLMGSEVPPRRKFIQAHARSVRNLDV
jgi:DNA gyrase subunit B